jgi:recombinational DNA repair ATPase RecF
MIRYFFGSWPNSQRNPGVTQMTWYPKIVKQMNKARIVRSKTAVNRILMTLGNRLKNNVIHIWSRRNKAIAALRKQINTRKNLTKLSAHISGALNTYLSRTCKKIIIVVAINST